MITKRDLIDAMTEIDDDQPIIISVDVLSVDPIEARRVIADNLHSRQWDNIGMHYVLSVEGDWNDAKEPA